MNEEDEIPPQRPRTPKPDTTLKFAMPAPVSNLWGDYVEKLWRQMQDKTAIASMSVPMGLGKTSYGAQGAVPSPIIRFSSFKEGVSRVSAPADRVGRLIRDEAAALQFSMEPIIIDSIQGLGISAADVLKHDTKPA